MKDKPNIVYIASSGHSGSTLLDMLIGSSNDVISVGELNFWDKYVNSDINIKDNSNYHHFGVCTCGKKIIECDFWKIVTNDFSKKYVVNTRETSVERKSILKFFLNPFSNINNVKIQKNDYMKLLKDIFQSQSETKYIVDSSKFRNKLIQLIKEHEKGNINLKIIYIIKDGRGTSFSYKKRESKNFYIANLYWIWNNLILKKIIRKSQCDTLLLSYDLFAQYPEKYISNIEKFLKIRIDVNNIKNKEYHNIAGNNMRFKGVKQIKYDQKWKKELNSIEKIYSTIISHIPNKLWVYNKK